VRYLIITYYRKANGQIDESTAVAKNLKMRDHQTASVILDFKKLQVVKANLNGASVPRDFNKIVEYYMQHYKSTIERLFKENGYEIEYKNGS
jgi:cupin superfamily acireductone dioxygenase involved in methionine salvage